MYFGTPFIFKSQYAIGHLKWKKKIDCALGLLAHVPFRKEALISRI